jgi:hypothetical protein
VSGFFPFHRTGKIATPVGRYFNDAHNVVAHPDTATDWPVLLKACGVKSYDFHALAGSSIRHRFTARPNRSARTSATTRTLSWPRWNANTKRSGDKNKRLALWSAISVRYGWNSIAATNRFCKP